jgi:hypothetical protein
MICVLQDNFATVLKTVVTTVAVDVVTVSNRLNVLSQMTMDLIAKVATVTKPSQTCFKY